ncbi:TonB family protein [uncultured Desulfovibrio sp.]|uniref:TonB family protein n=1 Tax=uncultured Desulfovibrio sp. TaxID=167968 RepID=UPI0026367B6D|nr:TonB family protein [uncultured Desulfovibrio sp.]
MRLASYVLSFCLHAAVFLLIWFWPHGAPLRLDTPPVMISLVEGDPGGNRTPSPILGHMGEPGDGPKAPTPPAPKAEVAAPERQEIKEPKPLQPQPRKETPVARKPEPKPEQKPQPKPEPKEEAKPVAAKKDDKPKPKEEPKKEAKEQKKPEPPKPQKKDDKPKPGKSSEDPVAAALQQARRKATSRAESGDRGNAVEQALAQARRNAGGNRGGGGGEGEGPGGGGLGDVYMGQVMLAVRPNWGFASAGRVNLRCVVNVRVDAQGKVQQTQVTRSSGNAQFDASAVNAIVRTSQSGDFPPPPSAAYGDLDLVFTLDEMMGR